jgi:hypothetical protein
MNKPDQRNGCLGHISLISMFFLCLSASTSLANAPRTNSDEAITLKLEAEDFQFLGNWTKGGTYADCSGRDFLFSSTGAEFPAATVIEIPRKGRYTLWVRTVDFPGDRPGERYCTVSVGPCLNSRPFGKSGKAGWSWEKGDVFDLSQGPVLLTLRDNPTVHYSRVDAMILSNDRALIPKGRLGDITAKNAKVINIDEDADSSPVKISPVSKQARENPLARLKNEYLQVTFIPAIRAGKKSVCPQLDVKTKDGWVGPPLNPSAESYQVVSAGDAPPMQIAGFHPKWPQVEETPVVLELDGTRIETVKQPTDNVIWNAGQGYEGIVRSAKQTGPDRVVLDFYPTDIGSLQAVWQLLPGDRTIRVEMTFTPKTEGQYSLGYFLFKRKSLAEVQELLMPMIVQRKRFPSQCYTLLQAACPTPVSLMQTRVSGQSLTWGISADPDGIPFEFPVPIKSHFGMHIRNPQGQVQPSIYGPLIGTPGAKGTTGRPMRFAFRVFVQPGDWYAAYRMIADDVFGWRDYRKNGHVSLTQATLNMIDLYTDDQHGGWWKRAKAPYQVESKNGSTHSTPLTALSLYYLTGDNELYRRRTLPTLEFILSRDGPHFSPIPEDTGGYARGSMRGPVDIFGTTVFGGLWQMSNRRTAAFAEIAFPDNSVRMSGTQQSFQSHNQAFDEWLGRYLFTGEAAALEKAIELADIYIARSNEEPPSRELGIRPFFLMSYVPTWEGLLRLYEVTGHRRFLDAAEKGARLVMTGMWTQPTPISGNTTIHPKGYVHGDKMHLLLHKGEHRYRIGWPRQDNDTPEKEVPGWLVSNVGLGFEQPTTYTCKDNGGRMILQTPWATAFLRLALYTGDTQFETYARNAVLGRVGNYAGYYYTTFTDLMQNPDYPFQGPDVGFIYYHHLPVHLSWTLDYLISAAKLRSDGVIRFPAIRQYGYAYFDNLVYGHAPGEIMGEKDAWLWFKKDLVALDNPQINYLMAHTQDSFFLIMMNESPEPEHVNVTFQPANIAEGVKRFASAKIIAGGKGKVPLSNNRGNIKIPARAMTVMAIENLDIHVSAHQVYAEPTPSVHPGFIKVNGDRSMEIRAAAIQIKPGPWQAYVWSTADSGSLKEISLTYTIGSKTGIIKDTDYPYEFSVPVPAGRKAFRFRIQGIKTDSNSFHTQDNTIGVAGDITN